MKKNGNKIIRKFTIVTALVLSSAIYCRAGFFDKLDNAINTAKIIANTNTPVQPPAAEPPAQQPTINQPAQQPVANPPVQNSQVANPSGAEVKSVEPSKDVGAKNSAQPSAAVANPQANGVTQPEQNANPSPQKIKAFKTLNFGDDTETVKEKLSEILGSSAGYDYGHYLKYNETFWRALFDTDAEYEPYKFNLDYMADQSYKLRSLMTYFGENGGGIVGVNVISGKNDLISAHCFQFDHGKENGGLAVVHISYLKYDLDKLVAGFIQNFPNAKKGITHYKIELNPTYPGAFIELNVNYLLDINKDRKAKLTFNTEKRTVTFTEKSQLSESEKTSLLEKVKNDAPMAPEALFVSKQIIDFHMNNYRQFIEAESQAQKAKAKKEADAASGF